MNSKTAKKLRQIYRRDLRHKLGVDKSILDVLLITRPKRLPKMLWLWGARFYFNPKLIDKLFARYK